MLRTPASLSGYPTSTLAGLPPAASAQGQIVRVTDIGIAGVGILVISDGVRWLPLGPQVLARGNVQAATTGSVTENTLGTVTVPGNLLGLNGGLTIHSTWSCTNSANTKTLRIRYGGAAGAQLLGTGITTNSLFSDIRRMRNRNAAAAQVCSFAATGFSIGVTTSALATGAIDSSVDQPLIFTGQNGLASESIALEAYEVIVEP